MADYKLVYENAEKIYGSETGIPAYKADGTVDTDIDTFIVDRENLEGHKLVYGKKVGDNMVIYVSESGIPAEGDKPLSVVQEQAECGIKHNYEDKEDPDTEEKEADDKCDECGKAGHTEVEIPAVPVTCTTNGSTAGVKCSVCEKILVAPEVILATGHTPDAENKKCTVCEADLSGEENGDGAQ